MFGPKLRNVFKSRWHALFWAASVLLTAYCTVPEADEMVDQQNATVAAASQTHKNPWAKDTAP